MPCLHVAYLEFDKKRKQDVRAEDQRASQPVTNRRECPFRSPGSLALPKCKSSRHPATFLLATILLWNSLRSRILSASSPASFFLRLLYSHFESNRYLFGLHYISSPFFLSFFLSLSLSLSLTLSLSLSLSFSLTHLPFSLFFFSEGASLH